MDDHELTVEYILRSGRSWRINHPLYDYIVQPLRYHLKRENQENVDWKKEGF